MITTSYSMATTIHVQVNMKSSDRLSIGQLAARFGLATHVLRHWEEQGLLTPVERVNGRRYYDEPHAARITMILRGKDMGLSLAQIAEIVSEPNHDGHKVVLREHRRRIVEQIHRLEAAKRMLDHALDCPHDDVSRCAEFQEVARASAPLGAHGHVVRAQTVHSASTATSGSNSSSRATRSSR
jgi:MerR family transcriptional regulator, copper efflux regulator